MDSHALSLSNSKVAAVNTTHMNLVSFTGEVTAIIWDEKGKDKQMIAQDLFTKAKDKSIHNLSTKKIHVEEVGTWVDATSSINNYYPLVLFLNLG